MKLLLIKSLSLIFIAQLVACGGGGGSEPSELEKVAPIADAGTNQSTNEFTEVILSGSGTDQDGTIVSYQWKQVSGITATLSLENTSTLSVAAPAVIQNETLEFELTVTDNDGLSDSDLVSVIVQPVNAAPTANAGEDQNVNEQTTIMITGSGTDSDGTIISYQWVQTSGLAATLSNENTSILSLLMPEVTQEEALEFQLTVTDNEGLSGSDLVSVIVQPVNANATPTANAGEDQNVNEQTTMMITGSGTDSDGTIISYQWIQTSGLVATLSNENTSILSVLTPTVTEEESLEFQLTVTDNEGLSDSDLVSVIVQPVNASPTANAGDDQSASEQTTMMITGSGIDSDGTIISYQWIQTSGLVATLSNENTSILSVIMPTVTEEESLEFQLTVTDNEGLSDSDLVSVIVQPVNAAPTANAGDDQSASEQTTVMITGSGTDSDGTIISYQWIQISGIAATLSNEDTSILSVLMPEVTQDESLEFQLTVTDNEGLTSSDIVDVTVTNRTEFLWSDIAAWDGSLPKENDNVTIASGITITLDITPPSLGAITIEGTLIFGSQNVSLTASSMLVEGSLLIGDESEERDTQSDLTLFGGLTIQGETVFGQQNISLAADWIIVDGSLLIGSESAPYTRQAVITLTGDSSEDIMGMGSRGLFVRDGILELHGNPPQTTWTKISQHIEAGDTQFSVLDNAGWQAGDQIVLAPTDFYYVGGTQLLTLDSVSALDVIATQPVEKFHWGLMQYATTSGVSLTQDSTITPPATSAEGSTPLELDERAEVGNLTRNIIIQSIDDLLWQNEGYGAQVMVMSLESEIKIDGVEFQRSGQSGLLGRYPLHWHELSYAENGAELGDVNGHYVRNSSIHNSTNRCVTIHATNGVRFENNICYDIKGHGIFLEDAVERRNIIENNLILGVRNPTADKALMLHELAGVGGSSGMWASNPDNTVRNNVFADAQGFGLWMAFPGETQGANKAVDIIPNNLPLGNFDFNVTHSNYSNGVMFDNSQIDDEGNVYPLEYAAKSEEGNPDPGCPDASRQSVNIKGWELYKNGKGNLWSRVGCPRYEEFVSADSEGQYFSGGGRDGLISRVLLVGTSLNNASPQPRDWVGPATGMATYHSSFDITNNIVVNFPLVENKTSGAFATDDYYIRPVERGMIRSVGNLLINSHGGHRSDAKIDENIVGNFAQGYEHFVFAGALYDASGIWGQASRWSVYNNPFLTFGANCVAIEPVSENVSSCDGDYFGVKQFFLDQTGNYYVPTNGIFVERFDELSPEAPPIGSWDVKEAIDTTLLHGMKHFAVRPNGIYKLDFPTSTIPNDVSVELTNMHNASDSFVMAFRFDGTNEALVYSTTRGYPWFLTDEFANSASSSTKHDYTRLASKQAVINSQGESFWQDSANDLVWVKIARAELEQIQTSDDEFSDINLYKIFTLRIW